MRKEVEQNLNFSKLEKEYLEKQNSWKIEEAILSSFSKQELKNLIENTNDSYLESYMPYKYAIMRKKFRFGYEKLNKLEKYFIEQVEYYFNGGFELAKTKKFLERLKKYYKLHYECNNNNQNYKYFDIKLISIVEVISNYIKLPNNLRRNIKCPLHKEKTGSFRIYKNTNSFYCFGCHKGGGVVEFVSEIENISKKEAFKKLIKLYSN